MHWAVSYAFADAFQGSVALIRDLDLNPAHLPFVNIFKAENGIFELADPSPSEALVGLFSNLILAFISVQRNSNNTATVTARVWDGSSIWIDTTWILWVTYSPALLIAIPLALYGLFTIHWWKRGWATRLQASCLPPGTRSWMTSVGRSQMLKNCRDSNLLVGDRELCWSIPTSRLQIEPFKPALRSHFCEFVSNIFRLARLTYT
jgi:hypothetical protein